MEEKQTPTEYGAVTKFLHWAVVLFFINQFVSAAIMLWTNTGSIRMELFGWHKAVGTLILMVVFIRLIWRKNTVLPEWAPGMMEWEKSSVHFIERWLYVLMFTMPLSGLLMSLSGGREVGFFSLFTIPGLPQPNPILASLGWFLHRVISYAIIGMVSLHVAFVVRRSIFERDGYLRRMLPFTKQR